MQERLKISKENSGCIRPGTGFRALNMAAGFLPGTRPLYHSQRHTASYTLLARFLKKLMLFMLLLGGFHSLSAQTVYPVQANVIINSPYSLSLNEYTQPNYDRFQAIVQLLDQQQGSLDVKFRLIIDGPGDIRLETRQAYIASQQRRTITAASGIYTGSELSGLFDPANLQFSGYSRGEYLDKGTLPEGAYTFTLEVLDANTGTPVSNNNTGFFTAYVTKNDPPFLNLPADNSTIVPDQVQNINFNWTPRHVSPNSSFNTVYTLEIVRVRNGKNPYDAFNAANRILQREINAPQTTYNYSVNDPDLQEQARYAWRVTAADVSGRDMFKNGGRSEVYTFYYGDECENLANASLSAGGTNSIEIGFDANDMHTQYEVQYRRAGTNGSWNIDIIDNPDNSPLSDITISGLEPATAYSVKVIPSCGANELSVKDLGTATTDEQGPGNNNDICESPERLFVQNENDDYTISWEEMDITRFRVNYKTSNQTSWQTEDTTENEYTLTLQADELPAMVRVDAVCNDSTVRQGDPIQLEEGNDGFMGDCGEPDNISLNITNPGDSLIIASWNQRAEHVRFDFRYRLRGSSTWNAHENLTNSRDSIHPVMYEQTYAWQVKYYCDSGSAGYTATDYFSVENPEEPPEDTGTGDCFPPPAVSHEVRDSNTVWIVWDEVADAEDYMLYYRKTGAENWQVQSTNDERITLDELAVDSAYEYKLRCQCQDGPSIFTDLASFDLSAPPSRHSQCPVVDWQSIDTLTTSTSLIKLMWDTTATAHTGYVLQYKSDNQSISNWYQTQVDNLPYTVNNLSSGTTYNFRIKAICGSGQSHLTRQKSFATKSTTDPPGGGGDFECGKEGQLCDKDDNQVKNTGLDDVEQITAADWPVNIEEPELSGTAFNGTGTMAVPYFDNAEVNLNLEGVKINEDNCMVEGRIEVEGFTGYVIPPDQADEWQDILDDINSGLDEAGDIADQVDDVLSQVEDKLDNYEDMSSSQERQIKNRLEQASQAAANGDVETAQERLQQAGDLIQQRVDEGDLSRDDQKLAEAEDSLAEDQEPFKVLFEQHDEQQYGIDPYTENSYVEYQRRRVLEQDYMYGYKALAEGEADYLSARWDAADDKGKYINYETSDARIVKQQHADAGKHKLQLTGQTNFSDGLLTAFIKKEQGDSSVEIETGYYHLATYAKENKELVVVPVNNAAVPTGIATTLNDIYESAVIQWNVTTADNFSFDLEDGQLEVGNSGMLSNYTTEMNDLLNDYKDQENIADDKYYIFVVEEGNNSDYKGYMPRKKRAGFLFLNQNSNREEKITTIAHELGHGAFRLKHPYEEYSSVNEGETDNLMDAGGGRRLHKYQWDLIHDPVIMLGLFDSDSSGALLGKQRDILSLSEDSKTKLGKTGIELIAEISNWEAEMEDAPFSSNLKSNFELVYFCTKELDDNYHKEIVKSQKIGLDENEPFTWDGNTINNIEIDKDNVDNYKMYIGIVPSIYLEDNINSWKFHPHENESSEEDFPAFIQKTEDSQEETKRFADILKVDFGIEPAWVDWQEASDEAKSITGSYEQYENIQQLLVNEDDGIGEIFSEIDNPLQHIYDSTKEINFLGNNIRVHKELGDKLLAAEESLGTARVNELTTGNHPEFSEHPNYAEAWIGGVSVRSQYSNDEAISIHSYGLAIDIYSKANIYLNNNDDHTLYNSIYTLIEQVTGYDLTDNSVKSITTIFDAQEKFLNELSDINKDEFVEIYDSVDNYNNKENIYSIDDLGKTNPFTELEKFKKAISNDNINKRILKKYIYKIKFLKNIFVENVNNKAYFKYFIYNESSRNEFDNFVDQLLLLYNDLQALEEDDISEDMIINIFSSVSVDDYETEFSHFPDEYAEFKDSVTNIGHENFGAFARTIKNYNTFDNNLFSDGFCNLPKDIIEAIIGQDDLTWGGLWNSKSDFMHFEIPKGKVKNYFEK